MKKIGLVGGISWVSTLDYYRYINEGINRRLGGLEFAECLIYSLNFGDVQRLGWRHAGPLVLQAAQSLERSGAQAILLCANSAHLFADEIRAALKIPLLDVIRETAAAVKQQELRTVGLLGTQVTMESRFFVDGLAANRINALIPEAAATREYIQHTLKEELGRGVLREQTKAQYLRIMRGLIDQGAQGIILGCTEIPLLIKQSDIAVPLFDTTLIHAEAAIKFACQTCPV